MTRRKPRGRPHITIQYRNVRHGGIVTRHAPDEWLEASAGWERVDAPTSVEELLDDDDLAVIAAEDNQKTEVDR
jgi:hypothetical protein